LRTIQINLSEKGSASALQRRQSKIKLALFLVSLAFSAVAFIVFDYLYTAAIQRSAASRLVKTCRVLDPVCHHALKPNCAAIENWGTDRYDFFTNNLGFRDDRIREVPRVDPRPRILMLGDSFSEGPLAWHRTYVGRIAARFPQYDFLNGGVGLYSPSNFLNVTQMVLAKGVDIDEVIVFIDMSNVQDEAALYRDIDASGSVTKIEQERWIVPWYAIWRFHIAKHLLLIDSIFNFFERVLVGHGHYYLEMNLVGNVFDRERAAWTYRKVNEIDPYPAGYAPLGVEGGIAKEKAKMNLLWQELATRSIAISIVVFPWPEQIAHDTKDSRQVRIWRDWCEGKCKRFISLFPAFLAVKEHCPRSQPGCWYEDLFFFGDVHYNAAGNALVADAVIKSLAEQPPAKRPLRFAGANSAKEATHPVRSSGRAAGG